ncbi:MAG: glycoside hydrolase, partial [Planctomycetota bacterium]
MKRTTLASLTALLLASPALAAPPPAPAGYKWAVNQAFTDEFNGEKLDTTKWHDHHPRWKGRPPAKFVPQNVVVNSGSLELRNSVLEKPDGPFTISGAAVVSKSSDA